MKKNLIAAIIAGTTVLSMGSAFAAGGQVNFQGEIIDAGCDIVNTPSNPLTVTLGRVAKSEFSGTGSTAAATKFVLKLVNCPVTVSNAMVKFDGTNVTGDTSVLALTPQSGVATGVGIQLSDNDNTVLPLFTASKAYPLSSTADNNLEFIARYIATAATITAGPANSTANFSVTYN